MTTHRFAPTGADDANGVAEMVAYLSGMLPKLEAPASPDAWHAIAECARREMLALLLAGHPAGLLEAPPTVEWQETIETGEGYRIRKLRYEGYPGLWAPALLYEPLEGEHLPAVLNAEGHHPAGNALPMKQVRCINLAKRGIVALSYEFLGMGQLGVANGHGRLSQLSACGVNGVGIFYLIMKRALDILLDLPRVDRSRVAMTGCSGGGWQTILLSSLDTRITAAAPVAGHSPLWQRIFHIEDIGDQEQLPPDLARFADFDVLTAMMAPRPCLLIYNHYDDCCFQSERTIESVYRRALPVYELLGCPDALRFHDCLFPRSHNYDQGNREQFYRFLAERWTLPAPASEIPSEDEALSEAEVAIVLPDDNATLLTLAREAVVRCRASRRLARARTLETRRARLAELLRLPALSLDALELGEAAEVDGCRLRHGLATLGPWTVPLLEVVPPDAGETALVLHDRGRRSEKAGALIELALLQDRRVLAVDLWGYGDRSADGRYMMTMEAAGGRPLGLQAAQLLALRRYLDVPCHLLAGVLTAPVVSLAAAALEPDAWLSLITHGLAPSLDRIVEWPIDYADCPALFCPGLLAEFDIEDLLALSAPVPVHDETRGLLRPREPATR